MSLMTDLPESTEIFEVIMAENFWKDIPGYNGKYQASRSGEIRRIYKSGQARYLTPYKKNDRINRRRLFVHLTNSKGIMKEFNVMKIIALTFSKVPPIGMVLYHINGEVTDNRVDNIGFITRQQLGKLTGADSNKKKAVFKVNIAGEEIEIYSSARAAAKANNFSYQAVLDRCHGKIKNPFKWADYTFRFEN